METLIIRCNNEQSFEISKEACKRFPVIAEFVGCGANIILPFDKEDVEWVMSRPINMMYNSSFKAVHYDISDFLGEATDAVAFLGLHGLSRFRRETRICIFLERMTGHRMYDAFISDISADITRSVTGNITRIFGLPKWDLYYDIMCAYPKILTNILINLRGNKNFMSLLTYLDRQSPIPCKAIKSFLLKGFVRATKFHDNGWDIFLRVGYMRHQAFAIAKQCEDKRRQQKDIRSRQSAFAVTTFPVMCKLFSEPEQEAE